MEVPNLQYLAHEYPAKVIFQHNHCWLYGRRAEDLAETRQKVQSNNTAPQPSVSTFSALPRHRCEPFI